MARYVHLHLYPLARGRLQMYNARSSVESAEKEDAASLNLIHLRYFHSCDALRRENVLDLD